MTGSAPRYLYLHSDGKARRHPELPRKTLVRLAVTRRIDIACCRLVDRGCERVAVLVWRVWGMWR